LLAPLDPRQLAVILAWPVDFLWQRPHRNEAATRELEAVAESLVQVVLDLERSIRVAFADAVAARARGALLEEIAASWRSAAALSEGRWRAGDLSEAEASAAAAEATIATDAVERGRRDAEIADARLLAALAAPWPVLPPLSPSAAEVKELPARDVLLERAVDFRPDLRAAALSVHAAAARARWERSRAFTLIATLDGQAARGGWTPRFSPGAQLDVAVFSQNDGGVGRADASVVRAGYAYSAQRLVIVSEVIAASAAYDRARSSRDAYARAVDALGKAARAARSAFQTGDQSYLFVVEALRREAEAKLRAVDLDADLARAEADVWRAVGGRPRAGA
jgi:outer membrane protein, heavy metal efflux system